MNNSSCKSARIDQFPRLYVICLKSICFISRSILTDWSEEVVDLAEEFKQDGVVAIDIAGGSNDESVCVEFVHEGHKKAFNVRI
jgi:hypothetical protein